MRGIDFRAFFFLKKINFQIFHRKYVYIDKLYWKLIKGGGIMIRDI